MGEFAVMVLGVLPGMTTYPWVFGNCCPFEVRSGDGVVRRVLCVEPQGGFIINVNNLAILVHAHAVPLELHVRDADRARPAVLDGNRAWVAPSPEM